MKKTILLIVGLAFLATKSNSQTVTDYDGNIYKTVTIGTQVWLKENLKVTHYRNGDSIPNIISDTLWEKLTMGAYCDYKNTPINSTTYGKLYNWFTCVDSNNLCPTGWHVPTELDWTTLENYMIANGYNYDGTTTGNKYAKSLASDTGWAKFSEIGTVGNTDYPTKRNSTGFSALPSGYREYNGLFKDIGEGTYWWTSSNMSLIKVYLMSIYNYSIDVVKFNGIKAFGLSVRCLRDTPAKINEIKKQENIDIYPNPAIDKIYVNISTGQYLKMQVYNTVGQCVLKRELNNKTNSIDISSLTKGIYILKLTSADGTFEKKIIKE